MWLKILLLVTVTLPVTYAMENSDELESDASRAVVPFAEAIPEESLPDAVKMEIAKEVKEKHERLTPKVANGDLVEPSAHKEIVKLYGANGGMCTATMVGPVSFQSAAHCGYPASYGYVKVNGNYYQVDLFRPPGYRTKNDHDIMVAVTSNRRTIPGMDSYKSICGKAGDGKKITFYGYGCYQNGGPGGGGFHDGRLRSGTSKIRRTVFRPYHVLMYLTEGSSYCFGDSGGPNFLENGCLLGVTSEGNGFYNEMAQLDIPASQNFLRRIATQQKVTLCGINKVCDGTPQPTPNPSDPRPSPTRPAPSSDNRLVRKPDGSGFLSFPSAIFDWTHSPTHP